jgi:hypothetical protein
MLSRPFNTVKRNYRHFVDRDIHFKLNAESNSLKVQESETVDKIISASQNTTCNLHSIQGHHLG